MFFKFFTRNQWRFLGFLSLFKSSATRLKVNKHPSIFAIVAPENRSGVADAAPGVVGGSETNALELVLLADAVDIEHAWSGSARVTFCAGEARMQISTNPDF